MPIFVCGMKQIFKYFLGLLLFTGALGICDAFVSPDTPAEAAVCDSGHFSERNSDFALSMPEEILAPVGQNAGIAGHENRVQTTQRAGFSPAGSYLMHHTARDYHKNYAGIEKARQTLLPYLDPTLEYVFLLRRILI